MPPKSTELDCKAYSIGRAAALVYLLQVRLGQRKILADRVAINLTGQALGFLQPGWGILRTCRIQAFPPPMARV